MNKKHALVAVAVGIALGYMLQNYIRSVPVVNKLPVLGSA
jgi:predicted small secreted protein